MAESRMNIVLAINKHAKSVPYGGVVREDGTNHGFKNVKGNPKAAAEIAEVLDNENLKSALVAINASETPLFTIGCEKAFNLDEKGHWARGFIELSFNYPELVAEAQWYFKLFYEFNQLVIREKFDLPVQYYWELEGNTYFEANPRCEGFSVVIWITTANFNSADEARETWGTAVDFLANYLSGLPAKTLPTIY
jgi:hypothetical protein